MSEQPSAEKDAPPVDALADLIDHWWQNADQPTMHHDGMEYVASLALARFLIANGVSPLPPACGCGPERHRLGPDGCITPPAGRPSITEEQARQLIERADPPEMRRIEGVRPLPPDWTES